MNEYTNGTCDDTQPVSDKDQTSARYSGLPSMVLYLLYASEISFEKIFSPTSLKIKVYFCTPTYSSFLAPGLYSFFQKQTFPYFVIFLIPYINHNVIWLIFSKWLLKLREILGIKILLKVADVNEVIQIKGRHSRHINKSFGVCSFNTLSFFTKNFKHT